MPFVGTKPAITIDNFGTMIEEDCLLVDKTLMIKELMDSSDNAVLIVRPRRFGKSLNMSMLQHFFAPSLYGISTQGLFDRFEIAKVDNGEFIKQYQGQYPVIFITLKDVKERNSQGALGKIKSVIARAYRHHPDLLGSDKLSKADNERFERYLSSAVTAEELEEGILFLSECLHQVHGKKVIILIDEYDTPLSSAHEHSYMEELNGFMRGLLSSALKSNDHMKKAVLTGILRVSKNNMLSGLNNLNIYTLFDSAYQQYFGFTESEIDELTSTVKTGHAREDIRSFYNGYTIGAEVIYNPWSVMNYLQKRELLPFWVWTSNDGLFKRLLLQSSASTKKAIDVLVRGGTVEAEIDPNLRYEDLMGEPPHSMWSLLLFCGYLTVESSYHAGNDTGTRICQLKIPNREIRGLFNGVFARWLKENIGERSYEDFLKKLAEGNIEAFTEELGQFLINSLSFRDIGGDKTPSERFYHGFFIGLTASLLAKYHYSSNRESGAGIYDVGLVPKSLANDTGLILEFKHGKLKQDLTELAKAALQQIDTMDYEGEFKKYPHVKKLLKIGFAFSEKAVKSVFKMTDL